MQSARRPAGFFLLLHSLLLSIPCALAGVLGWLVALWGWMHGGRQPFLAASLTWWPLSLAAPVLVVVLASAWQARGAEGLKSRGAWLAALFLVSAAQAGAAAAVAFLAVGWDPGLQASALVVGAPWLTLACHMRYLAKGVQPA